MAIVSLLNHGTNIFGGDGDFPRPRRTDPLIMGGVNASSKSRRSAPTPKIDGERPRMRVPVGTKELRAEEADVNAPSIPASSAGPNATPTRSHNVRGVNVTTVSITNSPCVPLA